MRWIGPNVGLAGCAPRKQCKPLKTCMFSGVFHFRRRVQVCVGNPMGITGNPNSDCHRRRLGRSGSAVLCRPGLCRSTRPCVQRPGARPGTFVETFRRGEDHGFDAIIGVILDVAKPTKVRRAFRRVPQMATAFKSELHQKRLQSAFVRRLGMQRDFYAHGPGSWSSRAKRGNERLRRGWSGTYIAPGLREKRVRWASLTSLRAGPQSTPRTYLIPNPAAVRRDARNGPHLVSPD